jgi:hypothetical protein
MNITTLAFIHGRSFFSGGVMIILLIALVALVVAFWPSKTDSK